MDIYCPEVLWGPLDRPDRGCNLAYRLWANPYSLHLGWTGHAGGSSLVTLCEAQNLFCKKNTRISGALGSNNVHGFYATQCYKYLLRSHLLLCPSTALPPLSPTFEKGTPFSSRPSQTPGHCPQPAPSQGQALTKCSSSTSCVCQSPLVQTVMGLHLIM